MPSAAPAPTSPGFSSQSKRGSRETVGMYAIQCCECHKWRTLATKDEYETIRENLTDDPWLCSRKKGFSCKDPADVEFDSRRIWVIDMPDIPKHSPEPERLEIIRRDVTKMDSTCCYVLPNGELAKCAADVEKFLDTNPEYGDNLSVESFSFTLPRVVEETVSHKMEDQ